PAADWSLAHRLAFRFVGVYLLLYVFPFPVGILPGLSGVSAAYDQAWQAIVPWVGRHVLHLDTAITVFPNGSGDTTYNHVQLLCFLALAGVATAVVSVLGRRRKEEVVAHGLLRIYLRYFLGYTMVSYGLIKVFYIQFPAPSPERLVEPFGDASPMGLLWAFMGYSQGYNVFAGGLEVVGGVLLLFRRTTSLGVLVVLAAMTNVLALNLAYDVPAKLLASHLVLVAVFLLLPELRRLADVLVLNRPTPPVVFRTPFANRRLEWGSRAVKVLFAGFIVCSTTATEWSNSHAYGNASPLHALYGVYEVESFTRDGQPRPLLAGDATAWRYLLISRYQRLSLRFMDDTGKRFRMEDLPEQRIKASDMGPDAPDPETFTLSWARPDPEHLVVEGVFRGAPIQARLRKVDASKFRLFSRSFHWVQEYPFNR
ncbi:hypothetical protein D7V97_28330, partial [Corallococcus sp. CA053C]|uniref:hypothetical protein n=1 Tax=Corallococcus sp. CA053C TaxID=2316732 RepID=UPI000EA2F871